MKKSEVKKEFQVYSDLSEVQKVGTSVLSFLKPLNLSEGALFDIRLCLEEALINAIKYGNSQKKELPVNLTIAYDDSAVRVTVEDQGSGFDPKKLKNCTEESNLLESSGRGVFLIHQLMDEVSYNTKGNQLVMVKLVKK